MSLSEAEFWRLVNVSREAAQDDPVTQIDELARLLRALSDADLERFVHWYDTYYARAYRSDLWEAGQIVNEGMGDDSFSDFRDWLISRGRDVYEQALDNPDSLLDIPQAYPNRMTDGSVRGAIYAVYRDADRGDLPAACPPEPADPEGTYPVDVKRALPRIYARYRDLYDWDDEPAPADDAASPEPDRE